MNPLLLVDFIPHKESLALKESGFDSPCFAYWDIGSIVITKSLMVNHRTRPNDVAAPLFQQAFRWFRKEHRLRISLSWGSEWIVIARIYQDNIEIEYLGQFASDEEAQLECLKRLIEIVKK